MAHAILMVLLALLIVAVVVWLVIQRRLNRDDHATSWLRRSWQILIVLITVLTILIVLLIIFSSDPGNIDELMLLP